MAKFCGNCGNPVEDTAKVCGHCGTLVDGAAAKMPGIKIRDPEKWKRKLKKGIALAIVVAIAVFALTVVWQYTGHNGLLHKVMTAYKTYDIDTLISVSGDMYFYGEEDFVEEYFESRVGGALDAFETAVGHSYRLTYEVNEIYTLSERRLDELRKEIEDRYLDFDVTIIGKVVVADLTVTAKQGSRTVSQDMEIFMSREKDQWRLLAIE